MQGVATKGLVPPAPVAVVRHLAQGLPELGKLLVLLLAHTLPKRRSSSIRASTCGACALCMDRQFRHLD